MKVVLIAILALSAVAAVSGQAWGEWSACSKLCGGGVATRNCLGDDGTGTGTTTIVSPSQCGDPVDGYMACATSPCVDCTVSAWSFISGCSKTCGTGTRYRTRRITQQPGIGGASCPATNVTETCNTYLCTAVLGGKGYIYWGPLQGPGPIQYNVVRGNTEVDVFLFDQFNFFLYQYDTTRDVPYETGYTPIRSSLNVENINEIVELDTTSNYYLVVDHTLIGAAQGTTENNQQVFNENTFYYQINGLVVPAPINTVPASGAGHTTPVIGVIIALMALLVAALR